MEKTIEPETLRGEMLVDRSQNVHGSGAGIVYKIQKGM